MLIRIPEEVQNKDLQLAKKHLLEKKNQDASLVKRISWKEGQRLQVMHIGPYNEVGKVYEQLQIYAADHGLTLAEPGHEIYISDPRRTAPDKLKTIVAMTCTH